ncbi:MAG: prephenate dehydrogenase/arogenate dehydrogenase family protein [Eubacterium sp.]|nr:prephenate dehydrogenase/arogenate dehydrogenase family protein [Eubacterium sp.]
MIAILDNNATDEQIERLTNWFEEQGMRCQLSRGEFQTILGIIGDTTKLDTELISSLDIVKSVTRITNPGKKENQKTRNKDGDFHRSGIKTVGIIGLGLIGGSFAKAYKENSNARVLGYNRSTATTHFAMMDGTLDGELILNEQDTVADTSGNRLSDCDLVIISLYNQAIIDFVKNNAKNFKKGSLVIDAGGLKRRICKECFPIAKENGFIFAGGHPMAGKKFSGYKYSTGKLYKDASMIIVPDESYDMFLIERIKDALAPCNFGRITVTSADRHDQMIAFTSEMAHIVSNAYIKSPTAREHLGFSAGSYKDMTRVAWLNEDMWTEIFMENKDNLIYELDTIINYLGEYKKALETNDSKLLHDILHDGKVAKEEVDGI